MTNTKYNVTTSDVVKEIQNLLTQKAQLSVAYMDTYYLYDSNRNVMVMLTRTVSDKSEPQYIIQVPMLGKELKHNRPCVEYRNSYKYVNDSYNLKRVGPFENPSFKYTLADAQLLRSAHDIQNNSQQPLSFIEHLVVDLVARHCPTDLIKREFYYFDKLDEPVHRFPPEFPMLNHNAKLLKYVTPRKSLWGFVNNETSRSLSSMNDEIQKVFDKLQMTLQNQRTK